MKKFRFLLLDANIVIQLFELGMWQSFLERCDVLLARTVAEGEAHFYEDQDGERHEIDLASDIDEQLVSVIDVTPTKLKEFFDRFDPVYFAKLDPGEAESLAYLVEAADPCLICSSDAIVFRVLAQFNLPERGLSLEEILQQIGLGRPVDSQFSKSFRQSWTKHGQQENIQGIGLLPDDPIGPE